MINRVPARTDRDRRYLLILIPNNHNIRGTGESDCRISFGRGLGNHSEEVFILIKCLKFRWVIRIGIKRVCRRQDFLHFVKWYRLTFLLKLCQEVLMGLMDQPHDDNKTNKTAKMAYSSHLCQTCECFNQPEQVERRPHEHFPELPWRQGERLPFALFLG